MLALWKWMDDPEEQLLWIFFMNRKTKPKYFKLLCRASNLKKKEKKKKKKEKEKKFKTFFKQSMTIVWPSQGHVPPNYNSMS